MTVLSYVDGEITFANSVGPIIVAHVCNELGVWVGANAKAIGKKWPRARSAYYQWYRNRIRNDFSAGAVQFVDQSQTQLNVRIRIANMVAQPDYRRAIRFRAFGKCLLAVSHKAKKIGASVHLPKFGTEQTSNWQELEAIVQRVVCNNQINVFVYSPEPDFSGQWFGSMIAERNA